MDYANMEIRLLAYYLAAALKDFSLADELNSGVDIHAITAGRIYGKDAYDVSEEERQAGKVLIFSMCYGGGVPTLQRQGVVSDYMSGKKLVAAFHESRPGIRRLSDKLVATSQSKGYINLIDGARLHPQEEHKMLNALIQGSSARVFRRAYVNIYQHLSRASFKSHIILPVHDEFLIDAPRAELYNVVDSVPRLMGYDKIDAIIPLETSIEWTTTNWAEKQPWKGEA